MFIRRWFAIDSNEFKKIVKDFFVERQFKYYKNVFYYQTEKMIVMLYMQRSSYESGYYINFGVVMRQFYDNDIYPSFAEHDIYGRFFAEISPKKSGIYRVAEIGSGELRTNLEDNFSTFMLPLVNEGVDVFLGKYPQYLPAASHRLKSLLGKS